MASSLLSILLILFCLAYAPIHAQPGLSLEGSFLIPGGDFATVYNPGPGLQITYTPDVFEDEANLVYDFAVGVHFMKVRQDTFSVRASMNGQPIPGAWETYNDITFWEITGNAKFHFGIGRLRPFLGLIIVAGFYDYDRYTYVPGVLDSHESGGLAIIGLAPNVGLDYELSSETWYMFGYGKYAWGLSEEGWYKWGSASVGIRYVIW